MSAMSDGYRLVFFLLIPLLILWSFLEPKEYDVHVCRNGDRVTYVNLYPLSDVFKRQMNIGTCEVLVVRREDYYRLKRSAVTF